jgi:hypothetical protein
MKLTFSNWLAGFFIAAALGVISSLAVAAPDSKLQEFWVVHDETSNVKVSHLAWQEILDKYLDTAHPSGVNRFAYAAVKKDDIKLLGSYLESLQVIDPRRLSRAEQLPYWVNFYNALTVQVILKEYPIESIRGIRFLSSPFGPWDKNLVKVQRKNLSLNDIEHGILRPIWKDPRIHFAVNCASIGCPNLIGKAFSAKNSDTLLEAAASAFINHSRGVEVSNEGLMLSSIFDWYSSDFGASRSAVMTYISRYLDGGSQLIDKVNKSDSVIKIEYQYDWALNKP